MFRLKDKTILLAVSMIANAVAVFFLFVIIAGVSGALSLIRTVVPGGHLHVSFVFAVLAEVACIVGEVLMCIERLSSSGISKNLLAGFVFLSVALLLFFIALASPYWVYASEGDQFTSLGIWNYCDNKLNVYRDVDYQTWCASVLSYSYLTVLNLGLLRFLQAIVVTVLLLLITAVVTLGLKMFRLKDKKFPLRASMIANAAAVCFLLMIIAGVAGGLSLIQTVVPGGHLHVSFAFAVLAMIACIVAEVFMVIESCTVRIFSS
ncbi:uncharacterized protein LOC134237827 [Saccostrea cucullata]|uniref:uncharacterized protein LOC134237827 n=1 Tax=Saccostrea cuccullata TaxID=36930 RepID=UPI002ED6A6FF